MMINQLNNPYINCEENGQNQPRFSCLSNTDIDYNLMAEIYLLVLLEFELTKCLLIQQIRTILFLYYLCLDLY